MALSATILSRCALMLLDEMDRKPPSNREWPSWADAQEPVRGLFGLRIWLEDGDLDLSVDDFIAKRMLPAFAAWLTVVHSHPLGDQYLLLPMGVDGAANSRYSGVALRCVIMSNMPTDGADVPSRESRYYDIVNDEFKVGPCATMVSFWVHTPDTDARTILDNSAPDLAPVEASR